MKCRTKIFRKSMHDYELISPFFYFLVKKIFLAWMAKFSILAFEEGRSYGANVNTHNSFLFHLLYPAYA